MDTSLVYAPRAIPAVPQIAEQLRPTDKKVPVVKTLDGTATLPADKAFVAQVVTARLAGTEFPESPGEIAPPERTLRPYNVPMLPYHKDQPTAEEVAEEPEPPTPAPAPTEVKATASAADKSDTTPAQPAVAEPMTDAAPVDQLDAEDTAT